MLVTLLGSHGYIADNLAWGKLAQALYGGLAYPFFVIGFSLFIMSALLGRAEFIRFFFGGDIFTFFKSISYGLFFLAPGQALTYFLSLSTSVHLDYQMMFYNFCGVFVFSLIFSLIFFVICDRPFHAMFMMKHDLKLVTSEINVHPETAFDISHYKGHLVGGDDMKPIDQYRFDVAVSPNVKNDLFSSESSQRLGFQANVNATRNNESTMFDISNMEEEVKR